MHRHHSFSIICDLNDAFVRDTLGESAVAYLDDYIFALADYADQLREQGLDTVVTSLRSYGDTKVPHILLELSGRSWADRVKVCCILQQEDEVDTLSEDARYVWDHADRRSFSNDMAHGTLEDAVIRQSDVVLSAVSNPDTNPFLIAARRRRVPILQHSPAKLQQIGQGKWRETEAWGSALATILQKS